jgi:hypothetical protein
MRLQRVLESVAAVEATGKLPLLHTKEDVPGSGGAVLGEIEIKRGRLGRFVAEHKDLRHGEIAIDRDLFAKDDDAVEYPGRETTTARE